MKTENVNISNPNTPQTTGDLEKQNLSIFSNALRNSYGNMRSPFLERTYGESRTSIEDSRDYSKEDIESTIKGGNVVSQARLSRSYYNKNMMYKRIILYYASLLKFSGILIPEVYNPEFPITHESSKKKYTKAIRYMNSLNSEALFAHVTWRVLLEGSYYGVIVKNGTNISLLDLPFEYCKSEHTDETNTDIAQFNVSYFDRITDARERQLLLDSYPREIQEFYGNKDRRQSYSDWITLSTDVGVCFRIYNKAPLFLATLSSLIDYNNAVDINEKKELEEIKKILISKVPFWGDGNLLLEPAEVQEMHNGIVNMLASNPNISVISTYADTTLASSKTTNDSTVANNVEKMRANVYSTAGVSAQLFSAVGNLATEASVDNDIALMMTLAEKYSIFVTNLLNKNFGNTNFGFKYMILPVSWYNYRKYAEDAFKMATAGYSLLVPAVAMGFSQFDLQNLKGLENDLLKLGDILIPLQTSFTQPGEGKDGTGSKGKPPLPNDKKSDKTIRNTEGKDKGGVDKK